MMYDTKSLDEYLKRLFDESGYPGISICLMGPEGIIFQKGYGFADIKKTRQVDSDTVYGIASMSKSFAALACAILQEEGKLSFSDPVAKGYFDSLDFNFLLRIGDNYYHGDAEGNFIWNKNPAHDASFPNNLEIDWGDEAVNPGQGSSLTSFDGTYQLKTTRQLNDGYDGLNGFIIKMPKDRLLFGDLELIIYAPRIRIHHGVYDSPTAIYLDGFEIEYKKESDELEEEENSDRIYENIVNENYINELDEIEFKISSYNDDGACYSKVTIDNKYLTNNLYCGITATSVRPEEFLIRRIVDHYSAPKIKLTQVLKNANIKPYTILSDKYSVNKKYINAGGEIDYRKNRFNCIMIEI